MSIQTDTDSLIKDVSVFNLALNVAGIINNQKNVAIYEQIAGKKGKNILEGSLGALSGITGLASMIDDTGVVMSADIIENSKLAEHPLENGKVYADNKILLPTEINIQITLQAQDYKDKLSDIKNYKDDNTMLRVESKFGIYRNMQIVEIPCTLNVDNVSRVTFSIKLREVLVAQNKVATATTEGIADSDTYNIGEKTGTESNINIFVE